MSEMSYSQLGEKFLSLKAKIKQLGDEKTKLQKEFDHLRLTIIPDRLAEDDLMGLKIEGVGTLSLTLDAYVKTEDSDALFDWLNTTNQSDIIKSTVNARSLKTLILETVKAEGDIPECVKVESFYRASIIKKTHARKPTK